MHFARNFGKSHKSTRLSQSGIVRDDDPVADAARGDTLLAKTVPVAGAEVLRSVLVAWLSRLESHSSSRTVNVQAGYELIYWFSM